MRTADVDAVMVDFIQICRTEEFLDHIECTSISSVRTSTLMLSLFLALARFSWQVFPANGLFLVVLVAADQIQDALAQNAAKMFVEMRQFRWVVHGADVDHAADAQFGLVERELLVVDGTRAEAQQLETAVGLLGLPLNPQHDVPKVLLQTVRVENAALVREVGVMPAPGLKQYVLAVLNQKWLCLEFLFPAGWQGVVH